MTDTLQLLKALMKGERLNLIKRLQAEIPPLDLDVLRMEPGEINVNPCGWGLNQNPEDDISSTNAEGSVASTQQNMKALKHWEATETPVRIRAMQVQSKKPSWQLGKSSTITPPQASMVHLGTIKLGETTKNLENPHIPTYIQTLPS